MATISGVQAAYVAPVQPPRPAGGDADGDNDGTKAVAASVAPQPQVSKPTATLGNNVDTHA